ncbi:MAG TPA: hypothetical protein VFX59_09235 [Polyangiales bacterium]|nr:hypothetical protein [Polyangiales bacterium]
MQTFAGSWLWGLILWGELTANAVCAQSLSQDEPTALELREEAEEPPGYRPLINEAIREYNAHNFAEAHSLFAKAHAMYPNARTLRGLATAEFELKRYDACIEHLESALDSDVKSLDETLRQKAEDLLRRARNFVARVQLEVQPQLAEVVIDGQPAPLSSAAPLVLRVGNHVLEFRAPGHFTERRVLELSGGEEKTLRIVLTRQVVVGPLAEVPTRTEHRKKWFRSAWLWTGVSALAAGTAVALTLALRDRHAPLDTGTTGTQL